MIAESCFHRWCYAQGLMNPAEIVVHVMKRNGVLQILQLLAETVSQSCEAAHRHTHGKILALNVAGRNVVSIWRPDNNSLASAYAYCGTVSDLGVSGRAVYLLKLSIVNVLSKDFCDTAQISNVTIRCELYPVRQSAFQISHEMIGIGSVPPTDHPAWNELGIGVNRHPSPYIAS